MHECCQAWKQGKRPFPPAFSRERSVAPAYSQRLLDARMGGCPIWRQGKQGWELTRHTAHWPYARKAGGVFQPGPSRGRAAPHSARCDLFSNAPNGDAGTTVPHRHSSYLLRNRHSCCGSHPLCQSSSSGRPELVQVPRCISYVHVLCSRTLDAVPSSHPHPSIIALMPSTATLTAACLIAQPA